MVQVVQYVPATQLEGGAVKIVQGDTVTVAVALSDPRNGEKLVLDLSTAPGLKVECRTAVDDVSALWTVSGSLGWDEGSSQLLVPLSAANTAATPVGWHLVQVRQEWTTGHFRTLANFKVQVEKPVAKFS